MGCAGALRCRKDAKMASCGKECAGDPSECAAVGQAQILSTRTEAGARACIRSGPSILLTACMRCMSMGVPSPVVRRGRRREVWDLGLAREAGPDVVACDPAGCPPHNPEVVGSNPAPATKSTGQGGCPPWPFSFSTGSYVGLYVGYVAGFALASPPPRTTSDVLRGGGMAAASRSRCRLFGAANLGSNPSAPATHFRRSDAILRLACFFGQQAVCCRGQHMGPFLGNLWAISWACPKIRTIFSQKPTRRVPPPDTSPPREPRRGLRQAFRRRTRLPPAALPAGSPVAAALLAPAAAPAHHSAHRPGSIPS